MRSASPLTLAVIGHVNHGKTTLVRALTGMETDRLKEEVERGLSIVLGFAWRERPSGDIDLIDAPGHEDFVRAMVNGATGARAVLLAVSAVEGFGRQTREHLQIAELLGVGAGVVAVTKADLLPPGEEAAAYARIARELRGSVLEGEPIVLCSAASGHGLEELGEALNALADRAPAPDRLPGAFLPIDRAFTIPGAGTVVTGTLQGRALSMGDEAVLEPSGRRVSLRQIQVHGEPRNTVEPGRRVAVSLRGAPADSIRAGEVLCAVGAFRSALRVDVEIAVSADSTRPLKHMERVRVLWGAGHDMAAVRLLGEKAVEPGGRALAELKFPSPVVAFAGQRAVLRRPSPAETVAGVVVLDPAPPPSRGRAAERRALLEATAAGELEAIADRLARRDGGLLSPLELARLARRDLAEVRARLEPNHESLDDARVVQTSAARQVRHAYLRHLADAHGRAPAHPTVPVGAIRRILAATAPPDLVAHVERALSAAGDIRLRGGEVALRGHDPFAALDPEALRRLERIETALRAGGLMPPDTGALTGGDAEGQALLALLHGSGRAISLRNEALRQTLTFHPDALDVGFETLRAAFPPPHEFTTGEARAALSTTRKFIVPVLEHFDARNLTVRRGDVRCVLHGAPAGPAQTS